MINKYIATIKLSWIEGFIWHDEFFKEEYNTVDEFKAICNKYVKKSNDENKNIYVFAARKYKQLSLF